jgi:hypothetical protein
MLVKHRVAPRPQGAGVLIGDTCETRADPEQWRVFWGLNVLERFLDVKSARDRYPAQVGGESNCVMRSSAWNAKVWYPSRVMSTISPPPSA